MPAAALDRATLTDSTFARKRMQQRGERPLFLCDWVRAVFIHFECDPERLQARVPYPLDLRNGRAYVSLVAFTMTRLRPAFGGRWTEWCCAPIATHSFMNVRTYVRHRDTPGIFFLLEWLPNRLSVLLGPLIYGLPYRFGRLDYHNDGAGGCVQGSVDAPPGERLSYRAALDPRADFKPCAPGSLPEFLLERYTAFLQRGNEKVLFHIWHEPWPQTNIDVELPEADLLKTQCSWYAGAHCVGANYSTGVQNVWVGRPRRC